MKLKILVADDSISIQKLVAMAFYNEDMEVEGISDGVKAYNYLADFQPDLVMADIYLPGINGFDLSTKIKNNAEFKHIRVLLLTSDFEELDEIMYAESKADGHISKPFKTEDIIQKVKGLLGEEAVTAAPAGKNTDDEEEFEIEPVTASVPEGEDEEILELEMESLVTESPDESQASPPFELSAEDLVAPEHPEPAAPPEPPSPMEERVETEPGPAVSQSETMANPAGQAEAAYQDSLDELEQLFHQLTHKPGASAGEPEPETASPEEPSSPHPDLIRETLSYLGEAAPRHNGGGRKAAAPVEAPPAPEARQEPADDSLNDLVQKHVNTALPEELPGLSRTIVDTVRQVVKEVAPSVIRQVIRKEIERIKKSEQV